MSKITISRAVILGATGPTGRALARELAGRGVPLRLGSRRKQSLERAFPDLDAEHAEVDALDAAAVAAAAKGCDVLFDCIGTPGEHMDDHPRIARNIAAALGQVGIRGVQVSSFWCYMPLERTVIDESHPREGGPPWAQLRREAEDILRAAGAAIIHMPDFFGPHVHTSTLQMPLGEALAGQTMNWIGSADTAREYAYVPDAMHALAELAHHEAAYGDDWIMPGAGPVTGREVAEIAAAHLGREVRVRGAGPFLLRLVSLFKPDLRAFMQMVPEYVKPVSYDATKLRTLIGEVPATPYREALGETLDWMREHAA